jgi:hypothetical protein
MYKKIKLELFKDLLKNRSLEEKYYNFMKVEVEIE